MGITILIELDPAADREKVIDAIGKIKGIQRITVADSHKYENKISDEPNKINEPLIPEATLKREKTKNIAYKDLQKGIKDLKKGKVKPVNDLFK
jgi:hypothetical protein